MRILTVLTYFAPHISGLSVYAGRLSRELVNRGHDVTILTSRYSRDLPRRESIDGCRVVRSPVLLRVSKGAMMPLFPLDALRLIKSHDVVHVHLPQFEASQVALLGRVLGKPVIATYHCDIELPSGVAKLAFTPAIRMSHYLAGQFSSRIVVNSAEYARATRLPSRFPDKVVPIPPPIELATRDEDAARRIAGQIGPDRPIVGFVGRFAQEKGIETLIEAMDILLGTIPTARLMLVGESQQVPGEHVYERLRPRIAALGEAVIRLGVLSDLELRAFYDAIDVLVLPSINSTESFGMTQAEAMLAGTPVVSTDLPGVREVVARTGMGVTVAPRDPIALAAGIRRVLTELERYSRPVSAAWLGTPHTVDAYERLFEEARTP